MNHIKQSLAIVLTLLACQVGCGFSAVVSEPTTDAARASLQRRAYPWYDAKKDSFRPLRPMKTEESPTWKWLRSLLDFDVKWLGPVVKILMWVLLGALVIALLIVVIQSAWNVDVRGDTSAASDKVEVSLETLEALPEPARGVRDLLSEAARLSAQSSFGQAMVFYYSWQLVQLNQQQLIEVQKGKTNRQYAREVRAAKPELLDLFGQSMRLFEDAFFGNLPVSPEDFQRLWEQRDKFTFAPRRPRR